MIIECDHCHARYQYDDARFEGKAAKKIKCAKCQAVFEIRNPAFSSKEALELLDLTARRRESPLAGKKTNAREDATREPVSAQPPDSPGQAPSQSSSEIPSTGAAGRQDDTPRLPEGKRLSVAALDGPDVGKVSRIEKPRVIIGRSEADIIVNDGESSRHHAAIEVRGGVIFLEDLGSTNGTFFDGAKVRGKVELQNHAEFQIGSTTLMLIITDSE